MYSNIIFNKSCENMVELPDNSIHLVVTSPPYNLQKEYEELISVEEYLIFLETVFKEIKRVLVDGGRVAINIANTGRKPYLPLSHYVTKIMLDNGFLMRGEIIWNKGASAGVSTAWGSWKSASNPTLRDLHEYILVFSKSSYKRLKNDKKDTIIKEQFAEYTKSIWNIQTESARKINHPAPFPVELPYRLIQLYSFEQDIVLDPFMGSGSTALAAINSNRVFVGYEKESKYIEIANNRINQLQLNYN